MPFCTTKRNRCSALNTFTHRVSELTYNGADILCSYLYTSVRVVMVARDPESSARYQQTTANLHEAHKTHPNIPNDWILYSSSTGTLRQIFIFHFILISFALVKHTFIIEKKKCLGACLSKKTSAPWHGY